MKDNLENIEKLFQDSFEGFEAEVDPNVWSNISNQIGQAPVQDPSSVSSSAGSASSGAGVGIGAGKFAMIVGAAAMLSVGSYFIFSEDKAELIPEKEEVIVQQEQTPESIDETTTITQDQVVDNTIENTEDALPEVVSEVKVIDSKEVDEFVSAPHSNQPVVTNETSTSENKPNQAQAIAKTTPVVVKSNPVPVAVTPAETLKDSPEKRIEEKDVFEASIYTSVKAGKQPLEVHFENRGTYSNELTWKFRDGDLSSSNSVSHTFEKSGEYWVILEIKNTDGRISKDSTKITVEGRAYLNAPNTFSPNGDGINDAFMVESEYVRNLNCKIFDRSNRMIYEWNSIHGHWNGTDLSGSSVVPGTYFYLITGQDEEGKELTPVKGFVTLFR